MGTPENTGDGPARVLLANIDNATKSSQAIPAGICRVLVISIDDVLLRILVTDTDGTPLAARVGTGAEQ